MTVNYWCVGAAYNGTDHQDMKWVSQGIWRLGWDYSGDHNAQDQINLTNQIKVGDRIAIKRMLGGNRIGIRVLHIGIVKGVLSDPENDKSPLFSVDWLITNLDRVLEGGSDKGNPQLIKSIHGPFPPSDWRNAVFSV